MRKTFKISEIAKVFNISRRTLIHYDEIGLFKPYYVDKENGYRYYSEHQLYDLRFIITFKNAGFSLKEIKEYVDCKNIEEGEVFLKDKVQIMKDKIKLLEDSIDIVEKKCTELSKAKSSKGLKPKVILNKTIHTITLDIKEPYGYIGTEKTHAELSKIQKKLNLKKISYIAIVAREDYLKLNLKTLKSLGLVVPVEDSISHPHSSTFNLKKCVTITHKDSFENIENSYYKLFDFIEKNSYETIGDSIELSNEGQIHFEKGVGEVIEIFIPVK